MPGQTISPIIRINLANKGIDIIRIDAVPYIWKELNTSCRNLPQVHTIVRMMRMIGEIVLGAFPDPFRHQRSVVQPPANIIVAAQII